MAIMAILWLYCVCSPQDTCYEVRKKFCIKLNKGLKNLQLPLGYLAVFVYSGIEPNKETKYEVSMRRLQAEILLL